MMFKNVDCPPYPVLTKSEYPLVIVHGKIENDHITKKA